MIRKDIKTPCVSFEFYQEVYHGSIADDKNFDNAELESEAFIDMITFGRFGRMEEIPDCVKFAICSVADVVVKYVESQKNDVVSESNDGYSITSHKRCMNCSFTLNISTKSPARENRN